MERAPAGTTGNAATQPAVSQLPRGVWGLNAPRVQNLSSAQVSTFLQPRRASGWQVGESSHLHALRTRLRSTACNARFAVAISTPLSLCIWSAASFPFKRTGLTIFGRTGLRSAARLAMRLKFLSYNRVQRRPTGPIQALMQTFHWVSKTARPFIHQPQKDRHEQRSS